MLSPCYISKKVYPNEFAYTTSVNDLPQQQIDSTDDISLWLTSETFTYTPHLQFTFKHILPIWHQPISYRNKFRQVYRFLQYAHPTHRVIINAYISTLTLTNSLPSTEVLLYRASYSSRIVQLRALSVISMFLPSSHTIATSVVQIVYFVTSSLRIYIFDHWMLFTCLNPLHIFNLQHQLFILCICFLPSSLSRYIFNQWIL